MEVTQFKKATIPLLEKKHRPFARKLESSCLEFADAVPRSSIISTADISDPAIFTQIFKKYIVATAKWRVTISKESLNENIELNRRLRSSRNMSRQF